MLHVRGLVWASPRASPADRENATRRIRTACAFGSVLGVYYGRTPSVIRGLVHYGRSYRDEDARPSVCRSNNVRARARSFIFGEQA